MKSFSFSRSRSLLLSAAAIILQFFALYTHAQTLAFPGAEGFGRYASGGRNGQMYIVTNLNDAGPGSFRDAVSQPNRIVVFSVGGVIKITTRIIVAANITIAGQTAPGDGIVVYGNGLTFTQASNCIVRYIRFRMGVGGDSGKDAVGATDNANNQIYDHVSVSWGRDENFSITGAADNITIQNTIIAQGLQTHSCGGLLEPSGKLSLFRNLYIDNNTRNPKVKGINHFVNNVVYNWGYGGAYIMGDTEGESRVNIMDNYYIKGPSSTVPTFTRGTPTFIPYVHGNYQDTNRNAALDGVEVTLPEYPGITTFRPTPYDYPMPATILTAQQAYDYVINNAGASFPYRDQVDQYLITELTSLGTLGALIANENALPTAGPGEVHGAPAPSDMDKDGIPDAWETAHGLNPNSAADGMTITSSGYTNLEIYFNELLTLPPADFIRPPSKVTATATTTQVTLNWKDNATQETAYWVERSLNGTTYAFQTILPANTITYTDNTISPNTTYYYRLKAFNGTDSSVYSTPVTVKTPTVPSAPDIPASPTPAANAGYIETGNLQLKWTGSANTTQYHIYFGTHPDSLIKKADTTASAITITGLQQNTLYYWRVDASNNLGTSTGDLWSFTTVKTFPAALVGWYSMNNSSGPTVTDSSSYNNDGEVQDISDIQWVPGKTGNAISLSNAISSSHILVPHEDQLYFNRQPFTISLWVKAPAQTAQSYLLHKGTFARNTSTGATGKWYGVELKDGKIRFAIDDDITKSEVAVNNAPYFTNQWVHLVVQRDTTAKKLRIFRNGFIEAEAADNTNTGIGQTDPFIIANNSDLATPFTGTLDDVKLFNYALTENQVLALYHTDSLPLQPYAPTIADKAAVEGYETITLGWKGGIKTTYYKLYFGTDSANLVYVKDIPLDSASYAIPAVVNNTTYYWRVDAIGAAGLTKGITWSFKAVSPKGMMAHYHLDETSSLVAADSSVYHQHGAIIGMAQPIWQSVGRFKGALQFNAPTATGAIAVPHADHLLFDQNSFTVSLWVKIAANTYNFSTGGDCYLIHKGTFEANTGKWYGLQLRDGKLTFAIDDGVTKTDLAATVNAAPYNIFTNQWKHIVIQRDVQGKLMKLYIDGVLTGTKAYTTGTTGRLTNLLIGNSPENKPFRDLMDDVRLYNYALTPAEIAALRDTLPPTVITKNVTKVLNNGRVQLTPADINNGSFDSTGIVSLRIDTAAFDCTSIGDHLVTLTATDANGNAASATATVTIAGAIPAPVVAVNKLGLFKPGDAGTIYLGIGTQQARFTATDTLAAAISDTLPTPGTTTYVWTPVTYLSSNTIANPVFTAAAAGSFTYQVSLTNQYGCSAVAAKTVKVVDARCGNYNSKIQLCYNNQSYCLPPLAALVLLLLDNKIVPGTCIPLANVRGGGAAQSVAGNMDEILPGALWPGGSMKVWPNPAGNTTHIQFTLPERKNYSVELYSMSGQLMQVIYKGTAAKGQLQTYELNTSRFTNGIYFIKLTTDNKVITQRIVIQH